VTQERLGVVFDSNVFLQAMISPGGPASEAKQCVERGEVILFISDPVLEEARDIGSRDFVRKKYGVTPAQVEAFLDDLRAKGVHVAHVPRVYENPFDPDDSHYVDLAIVSGAWKRTDQREAPFGRGFQISR
jgi:putative PIN family toxin of toxin-antitoxin system